MQKYIKKSYIHLPTLSNICSVHAWLLCWMCLSLLSILVNVDLFLFLKYYVTIHDVDVTDHFPINEHLVVLEFELRASHFSHLLGRHSYYWATPPALFCAGIFRDRVSGTILGSWELFSWADFKPRSSWSLPSE
jgi:hypothetical protein